MPPAEPVATAGDAPQLVPPFEQISPSLWLIHDTCNVYLLVDGRDAVAVDFGAGRALDVLGELGIERITDVLLTHHHRDQAQGLPRAVEHGARVWVPPVERELFESVDRLWQGRELLLSYNNREDRFSLLEPVPVSGSLLEYRRMAFGAFDVEVRPTPGHTVGSVSLLTDVDGRRVAFSGDLLYAPGRVWSLAATQWSYNGGEGIGATILSALDLRRQAPDLLLPSHGRPMADPAAALDLLVERMAELHDFRILIDSPFMRRTTDPYAAISPHLLQNLTSNANSYVLRSESGAALVIDYGYDFSTGLAAGSDRAARRPWLYTLPFLKEQHGVDRVEVAIPTHYHDDHVAGFNLLREVEGTEVWAGANVADVLEHPEDRDLPCLWFDPIPVDRRLELGVPQRWHEYEITLHPLPGHTLYAVAVEVEVDGRRVMALGDQLHDEGWLYFLFREEQPLGAAPMVSLPPPRGLNYVYRNRFRPADYLRTVELLREREPDLLLFGHWPPARLTDGYLETLHGRAAELERLHRELLPEDVRLPVEGVAAWIHPYQVEARGGEPFRLQVELRNPCPERTEVKARLALPTGWAAAPAVASLELDPGASGSVEFAVTAPAGLRTRRARLAADVRAGSLALGQQAEALVNVN